MKTEKVTPERFAYLLKSAVEHAKLFPGAVRWTGGETTTEHASLLSELASRRALDEQPKPMLTVRVHKGNDLIVDADELLRFVSFRIEGRSKVAAQEKTDGE